MFRIKAVISISAPKDFQLWRITPTKAKRIYLDENISLKDIGAIFATMAHELKIARNANIEIALETIIKYGKFPEGAIHFIGNGGEKDEKIISTGCCFGGVRAWQELFDIPKPEKSVWLGHSPTSWIEHLPNDLIKMWADNERKNSKSFFLEFTKKELKSRILELEKDLVDFTVLLELWTEQIDKTKTKEMIEKFGFALYKFE